MSNKRIVWFPITCQQGINPNSSSARIRGRWVFDKIEGCVNGKRSVFNVDNIDVAIFQKWCDYIAVDKARAIKGFGAKIILDMCDPTWLNDGAVFDFENMIGLCDAITFSSKSLMNEFINLYGEGYLCEFIPDRHDMNEIGSPLFKSVKESNEEKIVLWHGHSRNTPLIRRVIGNIKEVSVIVPGIKLQIVPEVVKKGEFKGYDNIVQDKWDENSIYDMIRNADLVLNPTSLFGEYAFKSDNKTSLAKCLGTQCLNEDVNASTWTAFIIDTLNHSCLSEEECIRTRNEYDVWRSVEEWKTLINKL